MGFDLFQSRRNCNEFCKWWSRDERDIHLSNELIARRIPSGTFMAKEITPEDTQDVQIANTFSFDKTLTTIYSPDDLGNIKSKDIVLYQDDFWIVVNVQKRKAKMQQTEFARDKNCSHYWYLQLRK